MNEKEGGKAIYVILKLIKKEIGEEKNTKRRLERNERKGRTTTVKDRRNGKKGIKEGKERNYVIENL